MWRLHPSHSHGGKDTRCWCQLVVDQFRGNSKAQRSSTSRYNSPSMTMMTGRQRHRRWLCRSSTRWLWDDSTSPLCMHWWCHARADRWGCSIVTWSPTGDEAGSPPTHLWGSTDPGHGSAVSSSSMHRSRISHVYKMEGVGIWFGSRVDCLIFYWENLLRASILELISIYATSFHGLWLCR